MLNVLGSYFGVGILNSVLNMSKCIPLLNFTKKIINNQIKLNHKYLKK